jgi:hypothetical protein
MDGAQEVAEHIEHAAHHKSGPDPHKRLGTLIGITMAMLGVLLAVAAAKVGGERTELIEAMVDQQNAHAKYQAQDIKHRMAVLNLGQTHALLPPPGATTANAPAKSDIIFMAQTVSRYLKESELAREWVESYEPMIKAHVEAQERYEMGQLLAEIGIVIASIALLLHRKSAWLAALAFGAGAVATLGGTYAHTHTVVAVAEAKVEHARVEYHRVRGTDKTTAQEEQLVADMLKWAGAPAAPGE